MKIISVAKTIPKPAVKTLSKQVKPAVPNVDLSLEERGFFKVGNRLVRIVFPR